MRKEALVTISGGETNRDNGKQFIIVEMSAVAIEKWGLRALMALSSSGITVSQEVADAGIIGIALLGYQVFMGAKFKEVEPLMNEMLECCYYQPSRDVRMPWNDQLVEEVSSLQALREKWLWLHTGFTLAELAQKMKEAISAKESVLSSSTTQISPKETAP